jgi:AcrR family transcriptional regulator
MNRIDEPRNERSRRTKAAILDATWELLEEQGPDLVTMSSVAERAGVSRRALYLHFSSRADLLLALHAHVDERLDLAASSQRVMEAPDAIACLEAFAGHLALFHPKIQRIDHALLRAKDTDDDVAAMAEQGMQIWLDGCRRITQRLADENRLAEPWTVVTAADFLWHFMFPEVLDRLMEQRGWSIEDYEQLLSVTFRRALVREETL